MLDSKSEVTATTEQEDDPNKNLVLSLEGWRPIFHFAFRNWLKKQTGMNILSREQLVRIMKDSREPEERQALANDLYFARGAQNITKDPDEKMFPSAQTMGAQSFDDNTVLLLAENLDPQYPHWSYFQALVKTRKLDVTDKPTQGGLPGFGKEVPIQKPSELPRPDFIAKFVSKF